MRYQSASLLSQALKLALGISCIGLSIPAIAGTITSWNHDNIDLATQPFQPDTQYINTVYEDGTKASVRGDIAWTEGDMQAPGISIVQVDDVNGSSCIMMSGVSPLDGSPKQCSDPADTNKHVQLRASKVDGNGIDLVFTVDGTGTGTYHLYQSLVNNSSATRIDHFNVQLGFGLGTAHQPSSAADGLAFALADGTALGAVWVPADPLVPENLWGGFPSYLYGDAAAFFGNTPAEFTNTQAQEDEIQFASLSGNYLGNFGRWLHIAHVPYGYFHDHDNNTATAPLVVGYWDGTHWLDSNGVLVSTSVIGIWEGGAEYYIGRVEGLSEYQYRYNITIGDITTWPTYDIDTDTASFTIRSAPVGGASSPAIWLANVPPAKMPAPEAVSDHYAIFSTTLPHRVIDPLSGVLKNDTAASGGELTARLITQGTYGGVTFRPNGTFDYQPGTNFINQDSFTYAARDGLNESTPTTVFLFLDNRVGGGCMGRQSSDIAATRIDAVLPFLAIGSIGMVIGRRRRR